MEPDQKQRLKEAATDHPVEVLLGALVMNKLLETGEVGSVPDAQAIVRLPENQQELRQFCEEDRTEFRLSDGDEDLSS